MGNEKNLRLLIQAIVRVVMFPVFMGLMVLLPAGTWQYPEAYVYFGTLTLPLIPAMIYFYCKAPSLLEKRMKTKERRGAQKVFVLFASLSIVGAFVVPGLDRRFGWSDLPLWIALVADGLVLLGYLFIVYVFKTNAYASRVVEIQRDQKVIASGPYAVVRHPMYLGMIVLYMASPVALGSLWGMIPAALLVPMLVLRIHNEEALLREKLAGYDEYCRKQKFRLIPLLW
jgi:protein-S-isoprenylcysteine O-methyltransferase Ste14